MEIDFIQQLERKPHSSNTIKKIYEAKQAKLPDITASCRVVHRSKSTKLIDIVFHMKKSTFEKLELDFRAVVFKGDIIGILKEGKQGLIFNGKRSPNKSRTVISTHWAIELQEAGVLPREVSEYDFFHLKIVEITEPLTGKGTKDVYKAYKLVRVETN